MSSENKDINTTLTTNLLIALVLVAVFGFGYLAYQHKVDQDSVKAATAQSSQQIDSSKYQAVFLTNGQVYFGKLTDNGGNYVTLTDIFYLQSKDQNVQPKDTKTSDQSNLTLIRLGKELHAPEDQMNISRTQMLFWENIKSDGKVYQAIQEYKKNNK